jgi:hypothetical protein
MLQTIKSSVASATSNTSAGQEVALFSPGNVESVCKSPPSSVVPFFISCLNCDECSEAYIKADYDSKTVRHGKCKHVAKAEEYDEVDFVKAFYYDSKPEQQVDSRSIKKQHI